MSDTTKLIIGILLILAWPCYFAAGFNGGYTAMKQQAVDHGHAEWTITSQGDKEWRWKEIKAEGE